MYWYYLLWLIIINFGGGYNLINGVFIVLVSGIYVFFIIVVFWDDGNIFIDIVLNGNSKVRIFVESRGFNVFEYYMY